MVVYHWCGHELFSPLQQITSRGLCVRSVPFNYMLLARTPSLIRRSICALFALALFSCASTSRFHIHPTHAQRSTCAPTWNISFLSARHISSSLPRHLASIYLQATDANANCPLNAGISMAPVSRRLVPLSHTRGQPKRRFIRPRPTSCVIALSLFARMDRLLLIQVLRIA